MDERLEGVEASLKDKESLLDERLEGVEASLKDKESLLNERLEGLEASLKDKESLLNERLEGLEASLKDKASLRRVRGLHRSMRQSLNKSHDQLRDKYEGLLSETEAFSDRLESLFSLLGEPDSKRYLDILLKASQRSFLTRIAYKIPPMRIILLGALASSGFFCTNLVLNSTFPSKVDPYHSDPSYVGFSLPYPFQKIRQLYREKFLINPQLSKKIIQEKYPEFGGI